jgi:hypothetical protein
MNTLSTLQSPSVPSREMEQEEMRLARKRASARMGFMIHATVFVAVGMLLIFLSQSSLTTHAAARHANWPMIPLSGWAIGLFFHGLSIYARGPLSDIRERMIQTELQRIRTNRNTTH